MKLENSKNKKFLFVVAHQDDEAIFAGGLLSKIKNKNHIDIVCMSQHKPGRKDTETRKKSLQNLCDYVGANYIQADFIDSGQYEQLGYNHEKEYAIRAEYISRLFLNTKYDYVITHNSVGEYGHFYHQVIHRSVMFSFDTVLKKEFNFEERNLLFFGYMQTLPIYGLKCDRHIVKFLKREKQKIVDFYLPNWKPEGSLATIPFLVEDYYSLGDSLDNSEVTYRNYVSYKQYLDHQKNKNKSHTQIKWHYENFNESVQKFFNRFNRIDFLKNCNDKVEKRILCLGARAGDEVAALRKLGYEKTIGVDIQPINILPDMVEQGDVHNLKYDDDSFDILYSNILDHLHFSSFEKFTNECKRILKKNGIIIFDVGLNAETGLYESFSIKNSNFIVKYFIENEYELLKNESNQWLSQNIEYSLNHTIILKAPSGVVILS